MLSWKNSLALKKHFSFCCDKEKKGLQLQLAFFAILAFGVFFSGNAFSLSENTKKVFDFSTIPEERRKEVTSLIPSLKNGNFDQSDLDRLVSYLVINEQYETAEIRKITEDKQNIFYVYVGQQKRIFRVNIKGAQQLSESNLRQEINIPEKSKYDAEYLETAKNRILQTYYSQGYRKTSVQILSESLTPNENEVTFQITEGPRTRIKETRIFADNPDFLNQFEGRITRRLKNEYFTETILNEVKNEFRRLFSKKGFFKTEIPDPQIEISEDGSQAFLKFSFLNTDEYRIYFRGNERYTESTLSDILEMDSYFSTNSNIGPELGTRLKNYYLKNGYAKVSIIGDEPTEAQNFKKKFYLEISEGPRVKISDFQINGNISQPQSYYKEFIYGHSSDLLSRGYFNRDDLQAGINNLIIDRQNAGYLNTKILSTRITFGGKNKEFANIILNIDESSLTFLRKIEILGVKSWSEAQIRESLNLRENEPLQLNKLEEAIQNLKSKYQADGYLEMALLNEKMDLVQYNEDASEAKLVLKIYEGPRVKVASILIEGNTLTQEKIILKELEFKPGDTLNPEKIEESTRRLQKIGHFNSIEIRTLEEKTEVAQRTVIVKVKDRDPGLFTIGIGVNSENSITLRGYTGLAYRNLGGTGRGASVRLEGNYNPTDIKYLESKVILGYLEPYLLDTRAKGRINYTLDEYISDFKNRIVTNVKQITWSLEQDITSHLLLSYDVWSSAQIRSFPLSDVTRRDELVIASTGPNLTLDYRDHPFNPSKGTLSRIGLEYARPEFGSSDSIHFLKAYSSFTHYTAVRTGWVWANSFRGGVLKNFCHSTAEIRCGVPYNLKGLTLGGQSTIRGFLADEAFPNEFDLKDESGNSIKPSDFKLTTTASSFLFKSELRFPISGPFGGAIFYDGGAVWIKEQVFDDPYRDAVGVGFRYSTPIGSVAFDIGYKLDRKSSRREETFPVYLSIGTF